MPCAALEEVFDLVLDELPGPRTEPASGRSALHERPDGEADRRHELQDTTQGVEQIAARSSPL